MNNSIKPSFERTSKQLKESNPIRTVTGVNPQHRAENLNKELNNVENLLKEEEKNKKNIQQKYEKEFNQINLQKIKLEDELDQALKEINEKEALIFKIQKDYYDEFKEEIEKYQIILEELRSQVIELDEEINKAETKQDQHMNISNLLKEEYDSYQHELLLLNTIVKGKIIGLRELESSYPKEFKFLQEDFQLAKELSELKQKNIIINRQIKQKNKETDNKKSKLKEIEDKRNIILEEHISIETEITETGNDQSLTKLKEHIIKNIKDQYLWDTIIFIIKEFFAEKIFDVDHQFHERLHHKLVISLSSITKDFSSVIAKKEKERYVIIKRMNDIRPNTQEEKQKYLADMTMLQKELEALISHLSALKEKYSKLEQLYNSILSIVQSKGYNCSDDLELKFKNEILSMIVNENNFSKEEIGNFEHLIQTFFTEMGIKERALKSLRNKCNKIKNQLNQLNIEIEQLKTNINELNETINQLKQDHKNNLNNINLISETIIVRNKNLKSSLESISEEQFQNYLNQNENALKNMKKIYGNKVVNKVYKIQKDKFTENVLIDHKDKKFQVNEDISFITQYDKKLNETKKGMQQIEVEYHYSLELLNQLYMSLEGKKRKQKIIMDSIAELDKKINCILEDQIKETAFEKEKLKNKYNIYFYLHKIKDINSKLEKLDQQKNKLQIRYDTFKKKYNEKTYKLHFEDLNIKNNIISVVMGMNEKSATINNPFRHQDNDLNNSRRRFSGNSDNLEETVQKSLKEFNDSESKSNHNKGLMTNSLDTLDYKQFMMNPDENILKEKLKPLFNGIVIYKKFSTTTGLSKYNTFNPKKADKMPPENCGYILRTIKLNQQNVSLDVYASSDAKRPEMKIALIDIKRINLYPISKEIIKAKEKMSTDLSQQIVLLTKNDYIQFNLAFKSNTMDLISPSYLTFISFQTAINEIINMKTSVINDSIKQIHFDKEDNIENENEIINE